MIKFFNTLTRRLEEFHPQEKGKVGLYTCGPTVYSFAHIGNFRTFMWEDLLRRFLEARELAVYHVMNITDVDDKIIAAAVEKGVDVDTFTAPFTQAFFDDLETLGILPAHEYPRATRHIPEMVDLINSLEARGLTYQREGSIYFRIAGFAPYGQLSGKRPDDLQAGASGRVDADEYGKDDARDFALWKAVPPGHPAWDGPGLPGRPGWHIECSAMSMRYLGESFDVHTGGVDNIFPHHENEIAQSQGATGKPLARYWLHAAHLIVNGEKMSKSLGNFHTLRDLLDQGYDARTLRYLLLSVHYRKVLDLTDKALGDARANLERLDDFARRIREAAPATAGDPGLEEKVRQGLSRFQAALDDDLNVAGATGALFEVVRAGHAALDAEAAGAGLLAAAEEILAAFEAVFGLRLGSDQAALEPELADLVASREAARKARDFAEADRLRGVLLERGLQVEDTPEGTRWKRTSGAG